MAELKKLGRYELRRLLGKGAMGVVYEGFDPTLNRRVAVKTILKSVAIDAETAASYSTRFVREAQAVARLNHPHIVQVHDFGDHDEVAYLVMEFIEGRELRSFFEARERFEPGETVRVMGELLDALDFAHERGVIHRDVKPANVMLDGQRRVKLADFGVARIQDSERSAAGTMVGTPAFMSPEQISGGKIDGRTDLFSAGTILYQLLTGEQPFKGDGAWTVAKQIMQDDPPRPSSVVQSISTAFDAVVNRALAKDPAQRYAKAREFAAALRSALAGVPPTETVIAPRPKPRQEPKASDTEIEFWRALQNSNDAGEFELYLEQFPEGTYAQLARRKIARLRETEEAQRTVADGKARGETEEKARREAEEKAAQESQTRVKREAEERAIREALEKSKRAAAEKARRDAEERAKSEAAERAKREAEEKVRRAQALARFKQQEEAAARAKTPARDEDATVAIGKTGKIPEPSREERRSFVIPAVIGLVVVAVSVGVYVISSRTSVPPAPVAQAPAVPEAKALAPAPAAPAKSEVSAAEIEKIRKETEERIRREYADKSAAEEAAAARVAAEKAIQEKQLAAKAAAEKAAAEKIVAAKSAQEKAAQERVAAEKAAAEKAAAERAAAEKAAAEKAAAERAAAEKLVAEKAAAEKAAEEKAAAAKALAKVTRPPIVGASPHDGVLAGRYAFRITPGAGFFQECDRIDVQEDIEIRVGGSKGVSGRDFSELRFQSGQDGAVAGSAWGGSSRFGSGRYKFIGRANSIGYAGSYEWQVLGAVCTGRWTLVRK